ncbi:MAG: hypothetical protein ACLSF6_06130 [Evtepia gabavorous]
MLSILGVVLDAAAPSGTSSGGDKTAVIGQIRGLAGQLDVAMAVAT